MLPNGIVHLALVLSVIPLNKKEVAGDIIKRIKSKFGHFDIQFTKTSVPSSSEIGVRTGVVSVKVGSEEISEKIGWFKD